MIFHHRLALSTFTGFSNQTSGLGPVIENAQNFLLCNIQDQLMTTSVISIHRRRSWGGTGGMCPPPPSFYKLLHKLLTTICVVSYALRRFIRYSCIYEARMSPALNGSSAIQRFKRSNAIEICDGITFDFYTGLSHVYSFRLCPPNQKVFPTPLRLTTTVRVRG